MPPSDLEKAFEFIGHLVTKPAKTYSDADIDRCAKKLGLQFPSSYRQFLQRCATFEYEDIVIFGLSEPVFLLPSVECAVCTARAIQPDLPQSLIPIHVMENGVFACIGPSPSEAPPDFEPTVVVWYATLPSEEQTWVQLASSFGEYLFRVVRKPYWDHFGISILAQHVRDYQKEHDYSHAKGGKLPHNTEWRPYRYCIQDVVFGSTVVRHHQEGNCLQIDVFLTANVPEYGPLAGVRALTAFLLSEAYKCGGTMELRFTRNVEGGQVPFELQALAQGYGTPLAQKVKGRIEPAEAKSLYAAMTGFSPALQTQLQRLEQAGQLKTARACYVVHHGVWSKDQLELIVLGSENPESILSGQAKPEQRHLYNHDLLHARAALLAGMFERILLQRERQSTEGVNFDLEDDVRKVDISFDGQLYFKSYRCSEPVELVWLYGAAAAQSIPENVAFHVLVRARDHADLRIHLASDIQTAAKMKENSNAPTFILVASDFSDLPAGWISQIQSQTAQAGIGILVCPEAVNTFDVDAIHRLAASRVLRQ